MKRNEGVDLNDLAEAMRRREAQAVLFPPTIGRRHRVTADRVSAAAHSFAEQRSWQQRALARKVPKPKA